MTSEEMLRAEILIPALEENFADDPFETASYVFRNLLNRAMKDTTFTREELSVLLDLTGWALDQAHDARGFGDSEYLSFLGDDVESIRVACTRSAMHS